MITSIPKLTNDCNKSFQGQPAIRLYTTDENLVFSFRKNKTPSNFSRKSFYLQWLSPTHQEFLQQKLEWLKTDLTTMF